MVKKNEKTFYLKDGNKFATLTKFAKYLKEMNDEVYKHHVNKDKNDFALWVNFSMKNEKLAKAIDGQISKLEMELELLRHLVHDLKNKPKIKKKSVKSSLISKKLNKK